MESNSIIVKMHRLAIKEVIRMRYETERVVYARGIVVAEMLRLNVRFDVKVSVIVGFKSTVHAPLVAVTV